MGDDLDIPWFLQVQNRDKIFLPDPKMNFIFTFTNLNCFEDVCPYQAYRVYVARNIPYVETPERKRGNDMHTAFEHRIGAGKPLPADYRDHEPLAQAFDGYGAKVELKLGVTAKGTVCDFWDKYSVKWRGKLDCVVIRDTTALLTDWKSGKVYERPFELEMGAAMLHIHYPQLTKIVGQYAWLRENRMGQQHDLSDTRGTWTRILDISQRFEKAIQQGEPAFPKQRGPLCGWCDVRDCENNRNPKYKS